MDTKKKYFLKGLLGTAWKITEWKDGMIFKTKEVGLIVYRPPEDPVNASGVAGSVSTRLMDKLLE